MPLLEICLYVNKSTAVCVRRVLPTGVGDTSAPPGGAVGPRRPPALPERSALCVGCREHRNAPTFLRAFFVSEMLVVAAEIPGRVGLGSSSPRAVSSLITALQDNLPTWLVFHVVLLFVVGFFLKKVRICPL